MSIHQHLSEGTRHWLDALSIGVVFGTLVQWLPSMAAAASLIWSAIRIYETATVQRLIGWVGSKLRRTPND